MVERRADDTDEGIDFSKNSFSGDFMGDDAPKNPDEEAGASDHAPTRRSVYFSDGERGVDFAARRVETGSDVVEAECDAVADVDVDEDDEFEFEDALEDEDDNEAKPDEVKTDDVVDGRTIDDDEEEAG